MKPSSLVEAAMHRRAEEQLETLDLPRWIRANREAADEDLVEDVAPAGAPVEAAPVELRPAPELDELEPNGEGGFPLPADAGVAPSRSGSLSTGDAAAAPVEQLKRDCAEIELSRKRPTWEHFKARRDRERAEEPPPESVKSDPHPLSNRGLEKQMAEPKIDEVQGRCSEPGCKRNLYAKGICAMHYQRARIAQKNGKRHRRAAPAALTGQDEFDTMIRIRDDFNCLSAAGQRYVLAALKG